MLDGGWVHSRVEIPKYLNHFQEWDFCIRSNSPIYQPGKTYLASGECFAGWIDCRSFQGLRKERRKTLTLCLRWACHFSRNGDSQFNYVFQRWSKALQFWNSWLPRSSTPLDRFRRTEWFHIWCIIWRTEWMFCSSFTAFLLPVRQGWCVVPVQRLGAKWSPSLLKSCSVPWVYFSVVQVWSCEDETSRYMLFAGKHSLVHKVLCKLTALLFKVSF